MKFLFAVKVYVFELSLILALGFAFIVLSPWLAWKISDGDWVLSTFERLRRLMNGGADV